jgi:hypothetical protein
MASVTVSHTASAVWERGRCNWRGVCSCGWRSDWAYAAEHAAYDLAADHAAKASA